jgi:Fic family protein
MNFILYKNGYPMLDIKYERRNRYYIALERSQVKKVENTFVQWFMRRYLIEHDQYVERSNIGFTMYGGKPTTLK